MKKKENIGLNIELIVTDKNGNIKQKIAKKADTFLKVFGVLITGRAFWNVQGNTCKDVANVTQNINFPGLQKFNFDAPLGNSVYGLVVGSSDTAVTYNDYNLISKISHASDGLYYNDTAIVNDTPSEGSITVTRLMENRSAGTIDVKEMGLIWLFEYGYGNMYFLGARDTFTTITLSPGDFLNAKYIVSWL